MAAKSELREITAEEKANYQRDGVVLLKQIYPTPWVDRLASLLDDVFAQSAHRGSKYANTVLDGTSQQGSSSDMVQIVQTVRARHPEHRIAVEGDPDSEITGASLVETAASHWHAGMREHNTRGPLGEIVHRLTGSEQVTFYCDQLFYKEAGSRVKTPFHQDKPYFLVDGGEMAVAWVPVDTVTRENGAMGYVRGSHKRGRLFKPSDFQTETGTFPEIGGIDLTGLDTLDHNLLRPEDMVYFDAEPGDVIVHHWATLHGSTGNTSATRSRRAASVRFALDGCHFFARPSSPEPFRRTVGLNDGDPLEASDLFCVVWPQDG